MRNWLKIASVGALGVLVGGTPALAQDFQWRGQIPSGQSIEVKGINGSVVASPAGSTDVEVTATRTANRSNPAEVRFQVVPHSGGVTICAIYPNDPGREPNTCEPGSPARVSQRDGVAEPGVAEPGGRGHSSTRNNDTQVHFVVHVPYGVNFVGRTVNGDIDGESLQGNVEGHTVNGSVHVSTTGVALANTVNGSITASMERADWPGGGASFKTVNGGITLTVPPVLNAELRATTVNGSITTDFPITVSGQLDRRHLNGRIGSGGGELSVSTVNGSIKLLKGQ
jgi:hypothetical protein